MDKKMIAIAVVAVVLIVGVAAYFLLQNDEEDTPDRIMLNETLDIFGNANNDGTIDQKDVDFINEIIDKNKNDDSTDDVNWKNDYPLADATHDGKLDQADVDQTKALVNSNAKYVNMYDGFGNFKHVRCDPSRIAVDQIQLCEYVCIMGQGDKVVCGDHPSSILGPAFYFDQPIKSHGSSGAPDYELIQSLDVDLYLTFWNVAVYETKAEKLPNTDVVYLGLYETNTLDLESSSFVKGFLKGGYIFNDSQRAKDYVGWLLDTRDNIKEISDKVVDKKTMLISGYANSYFAFPDTQTKVTNYSDGDTLGQAAILAGARLMSEDFPGYGDPSIKSFNTDVEWLGMQDIDYFFIHSVRLQGNGKTVEYVPEQGYAVDNWDEFKEVQRKVSEEQYVKMAGLDYNHIFLEAGDFRNNASSGLLIAAHMMKILYPELCEDFDPYEIHQEYLEWMGKPDFDIRNHGTFIVPPYANYY